MDRFRVIALAFVGLLAAAPAFAQQAPPQPATSQLPGGASQLQETHGDWRVTCAQPQGQKICVMSQQLSDKDSRQLILGVELRATTTDKATGTMVLPFGLAVDKPITLAVDDSGAPMTLPFKTCVPGGCLVTLNLDAATIASLKKGTALNVKTTAAENGQATAFKVSLTGFGSALDRTAALSKP